MIKLNKDISNMNEEEKKIYEKKKNIVYLCGIIIFLALLTSFVNTNSRRNINNNYIEEKTYNKDVISLLENIKDNYHVKYTYTKENETITLESQKENQYEVSVIENKDNIVEYFTDGTNYYSLKEEEIIKIDKPELLNMFKDMFFNKDIILEIIKNKKREEDIKEDATFIKKYYISLADLLSIYNSHNDTMYATNENKEITIYIKYKENIKSIYMDLTEFFKVINEKEEIIKYKIEYSNIGEIDNSLLEKIIKK